MNGHTRASAILGLILCLVTLPAAFAQDPPVPAQDAPPAQTTPAAATETPAPDNRPVLELSLDEAVKRAMDNNLDIAVEKFNPELSAQSVRQIQGEYDPYLSSTITKGSQTDPPRNVFTGGEKVDTDSALYNFGIFQSLKTGGTLTVDFDNNRSETNSVFSTFNPIFNSTFQAQLTQPLLRNFRVDGDAPAAADRQEEPRDLRRAVPADGDEHARRRSSRPTTTCSTRSRTWTRSEEPLARARSCSTRTRSRCASARWLRSTSSPPSPRWRAARRA